MQTSRVSGNSEKKSTLETMKKEDMYDQYMANEMRHRKMQKDNMARKKNVEKRLKDNKNTAQQEKNNIIEKKKNANEFYKENHQKHYIKTTNHGEKAKFIPPCDIFDNRYFQ